MGGLAGRIESAARELGFAPEDRPFRAHLTLARAQRGTRAGVPPDSVTAGPLEVGVDCLTLFRSELLRDGARYTALERFPLTTAEAPEVD